MFEDYNRYLQKLNNSLRRSGVSINVLDGVSKDTISEDAEVLNRFFDVNEMLSKGGAVKIFRGEYDETTSKHIREKLFEEYLEYCDSEMEKLLKNPEGSGVKDREVKVLSAKDIKDFNEKLGLVMDSMEESSSEGGYTDTMNSSTNGVELSPDSAGGSYDDDSDEFEFDDGYGDAEDEMVALEDLQVIEFHDAITDIEEEDDEFVWDLDELEAIEEDSDIEEDEEEDFDWSGEADSDMEEDDDEDFDLSDEPDSDEEDDEDEDFDWSGEADSDMEEDDDEDFDWSGESDSDEDEEYEEDDEDEDDFDWSGEADLEEDEEYEEDEDEDFDWSGESDSEEDEEYEEEDDDEDFDWSEESDDEDEEYEEDDEDEDFDWSGEADEEDEYPEEDEDDDDDFDWDGEADEDEEEYDEDDDDDFDWSGEADDEDEDDDSDYEDWLGIEEDDDSTEWNTSDYPSIEELMAENGGNIGQTGSQQEVAPDVQNLHKQPDLMANTLRSFGNKAIGRGKLLTALKGQER